VEEFVKRTEDHMRHFYCHKNINHSWLKKTKKEYRSYPASILEEHAQRRQEDGDQDLAESRSGASLPHCEKMSLSKEMQTTMTLNVEDSLIKALQKA
jgi:hypothetical protein